MMESMLTTIDNPYNPFTQWQEWLDYDRLMGYNTCGLLARLVSTSDELPEEQQSEDIDDAIARILVLDGTGQYRRVFKEAPTT